MKIGDEIIAIDNVEPRGRLEFTNVMIASALSSGHDSDLNDLPPPETPVHREILALPAQRRQAVFLSIGVKPMQSLNIVGGGFLLKKKPWKSRESR